MDVDPDEGVLVVVVELTVVGAVVRDGEGAEIDDDAAGWTTT